MDFQIFCHKISCEKKPKHSRFWKQLAMSESQQKNELLVSGFTRLNYKKYVPACIVKIYELYCKGIIKSFVIKKSKYFKSAEGGIQTIKIIQINNMTFVYTLTKVDSQHIAFRISTASLAPNQTYGDLYSELSMDSQKHNYANTQRFYNNSFFKIPLEICEFNAKNDTIHFRLFIDAITPNEAATKSISY